VYILIRLRVFHEVGTCGKDRSEQKDAVYHHPNAGFLPLLTIGYIVVNVAKGYTYDVQLEIKSGARSIQLACKSFFEPARGRLGERIPRDFLALFCGFFQVLAVDPTPGIREPKVS
jgi:hypothetical protein